MSGEDLERTWAEPWDRGRMAGLNTALNAVRNLNGGGHHEPSDPALSAAENVLARLANDAFDKIGADYPGGHLPGEAHRYLIECSVCGQSGTLRLSVDPPSALDPSPPAKETKP